MFLFSKPVVQLPKLTTSSATDLAAKAGAHPDSQALIKPGMSSSEYVHTLEQNKQSIDATKALAHGMPERDSVWWATQSSQKVADKLNPQEVEATNAAEAWVKNPTEATQAAAASAASKTDFKGPGGWAAQAAAWSGKASSAPSTPTAAAMSAASSTPAAPAMPAVSTAAGAASAPAAPALTASAVTGAVLLAAGLSGKPAMSAPQKPNLDVPAVAAPTLEAPTVTPPEAPPVDQTKMAKSLQPFLDLGKDIASGKLSWA
jgi:hypothetical protein